MKAIVLTKFGEPEVLTEREVDKPIPRGNEVLVKVYATSVNPADVAVRKGFFGSRTKLKYEIQQMLMQGSGVIVNTSLIGGLIAFPGVSP